MPEKQESAECDQDNSTTDATRSEKKDKPRKPLKKLSSKIQVAGIDPTLTLMILG